MSIKTRVRTTSKTVLGDVEVQHQRHRSRRIHEVASQLDVPTLLTPAPNHLLRFHFVCCAEKVSDTLIFFVYYEGTSKTRANEKTYI